MEGQCGPGGEILQKETKTRSKGKEGDMPRTNRAACWCRAATMSEAHTSLNSKQHPLKRPRVGLGSQKRQSRAVQKGKQKQARPNIGSSSRTDEVPDTQGDLCHPRFSQHGAATGLEPWKAYRKKSCIPKALVAFWSGLFITLGTETRASRTPRLQGGLLYLH